MPKKPKKPKRDKSMAVVLGTSAGFVTVAPTDDPSGTGGTISNIALAQKDTTPVSATKITEVGWWCGNETTESNFEVGLYSHDSGNNVPLNRLYVDNTNAKGTGAGWKTVAVNWDIVAETIYWIGVQLDASTPSTVLDYSAGGTSRGKTAQTELTHPWGASTALAQVKAIYAVVSTRTYSELAGTIAAVSDVSGNLDTTLVSTLSGTIAATSTVSGNLGSTTVAIDVTTSYIKRLVVAGKDSIYYESI